MNRFEKVVTAISNSFYRHGYDFSEAEISLIATDLLTSGIFENKIIVDELKQGEVFKWGDKEYIKLDTLNEGCLCLAKDLWFKSKFDDETNDWEHSELRSDMIMAVRDFLPDFYKLRLFDRDLTTDDGLTDYGHCEDRVSMLTCDEYRKYRKYIPTTSECYWTITAHTFGSYFVRFVIPDGPLNYSDTHSSYREVRPLICLDKDTLVEVEE